MHEDEQPSHTSGGVPHAFRNAVFWRWAPEMPRQLRGGFLTLLYALGTAANTAGKLRFKDGAAIRIQDIAKAVGSNEKDTRRYVNAAIAAGIVGVEGERRRGRPTLYVLLVTPVPDWTAAVASLTASRPVRKDAAPPPWRAELEAPTDQKGSGVGHPNPEEKEHRAEFGSPTPELPPGNDESSSGDRHPYGFGSPTPVWFGCRSPEQPRKTQVLPQEVAEVVPQPQDARELALENDDSPLAETDNEPPLRGLPSPPVGSRARRAAGPRQSPLLALLTVPTDYEQLRRDADADPDLVRRAVAEFGSRKATTIYGWRLVGPVLNECDQSGRTGTETS